MIAKIVDDLLLTGAETDTEPVVAEINGCFQFGTIVKTPVVIRYYGLNIPQNDDMYIAIDGDDKLNMPECLPFTRARRSDTDFPLNAVERTAFVSINCSIGWLGATTSLFCSTFASLMQQAAPSAAVQDLICYANSLRRLKKLRTVTTYPTSGCEMHRLSV